MLKRTENHGKDQLVWKGLKGAATSKDDFGDPTIDSSYAFCIYSDNRLVKNTSIAPAGECAGIPCWASKFFSYIFKDTTLAQGGILSVFLKEGDSGTAKFVIKGKGATLGLPDDLTTLQSPVTVQLQNSRGNCWGAVYSFPPATKRDPQYFKDKSD